MFLNYHVRFFLLDIIIVKGHVLTRDCHYCSLDIAVGCDLGFTYTYIQSGYCCLVLYFGRTLVQYNGDFCPAMHILAILNLLSHIKF